MFLRLQDFIQKKKKKKDFIHVYSPGARSDNPGDNILIVTKRVCYFDHTH